MFIKFYNGPFCHLRNRKLHFDRLQQDQLAILVANCYLSACTCIQSDKITYHLNMTYLDFNYYLEKLKSI